MAGLEIFGDMNFTYFVGQSVTIVTYHLFII